MLAEEDVGPPENDWPSRAHTDTAGPRAGAERLAAAPIGAPAEGTETMALYARSRSRRTRQIVGDLVVIGWVVLWAWTAHRIWSALLAVAEPARRTAAAASRVRDDFLTAGEAAGQIPVAGSQLRRPFETAGGSLDEMVMASQEQVRSLEQLAALVGVLLFVLPVAGMLLVWGPARVRFIRSSAAVQRLLDAGADLELFALRALSGQSVTELTRITPTPVADWRAGRRSVIVALAELELRACGLDVPPAGRSADTATS